MMGSVTLDKDALSASCCFYFCKSSWCIHFWCEWLKRLWQLSWANTGGEPPGPLYQFANPPLGSLLAGTGPHQQEVILVYGYLKGSCFNCSVYSPLPTSMEGHQVPIVWDKNKHLSHQCLTVLLNYQVSCKHLKTRHHQHYLHLFCVNVSATHK